MSDALELDIEIIVNAKDFLEVNLTKGIEQAVMDRYYKYLGKFDKGGVTWIWNIEVDADPVEEEIDRGRLLVVDALGVFIKKQLSRNLETLESLLDRHGPTGISSSDAKVSIDVTIPELSESYLKTREKRNSPGFFKKYGGASGKVYNTPVKSLGSSGGIYTYKWESTNSEWLQFNKGVPENYQKKRPVILILREYFIQSFLSLLSYLETVQFSSYEEVAKLIEARV